MKITVRIPDHLVIELRRRAAVEGRTFAQMMTETLRRGLAPHAPAVLPPLPVFHLGEPLVDLADRDALYRAMEGG